MDDYQLLIDLHKDGERQGPGGNKELKMMLDLAMVDRNAPLKIADIGCGTGASTLQLANLLKAQITAVDFLQDFLEVLETNAEKMALSENINTLCCSMEKLPFADEEYDIIWSEGAIYNIGFERGVSEWNRYLKPGGLLVVSEITWTTKTRPPQLQKYWQEAYPEIDTASAKIAILENCGYSPVGYFTLAEHCWLENYYRPIQDRLGAFLENHKHSADAQAIANAEIQEIELYEKFKSHYSYGVYISRKLS